MKKFVVVSEDNFKTTKLIKLSKDELLGEKLNELTDQYDIFFKDEGKVFCSLEKMKRKVEESEKEYYWFEEIQGMFFAEYGLCETSLEEIFL